MDRWPVEMLAAGSKRRMSYMPLHYVFARMTSVLHERQFQKDRKTEESFIFYRCLHGMLLAPFICTVLRKKVTS